MVEIVITGEPGEVVQQMRELLGVLGVDNDPIPLATTPEPVVTTTMVEPPAAEVVTTPTPEPVVTTTTEPQPTPPPTTHPDQIVELRKALLAAVDAGANAGKIKQELAEKFGGNGKADTVPADQMADAIQWAKGLLANAI